VAAGLCVNIVAAHQLTSTWLVM